MKLHLPVMLFTALMAVMTAMPSRAEYTLSIGDKVIENWDGKLTTDDTVLVEAGVVSGLYSGSGSFILDDIALTIEKKGDDDTATTVYLYGREKKNDSDTFAHSSVFHLVGSNTYKIGKGCELVIKTNTASLAEGYTNSRYSYDYRPTGKLELSGTVRAEEFSPKLFEAGSQNTEVTGIVDIYDGGKIQGYMGSGSGTSTITVFESSEGGSTVTGNLCVHSGGSIVGGVNISSAAQSNTTCKVSFTLDGGEFLTDEYSLKNSSSNIGVAGSTSYENATTETTITVINGGNFGGGKSTNIATVARSGSNAQLQILVSGKTSQFSATGDISTIDGRWDDATATADIQVRDGATFTIKGGKIGFTGSYSGHKGIKQIARIGVYDSTFAIENNAASIGVSGSTQEKFTESTFSTTLELHGDSTLDLSNYKPSSSGTAGIWGDVFIGGGSINIASGKANDIFKKNVIVCVTEGEGHVLDFQGLNAGKISQEFKYKEWNAESKTWSEEKALKGFSLGVAGARLTGLQAGSTLTLGGQDGVDGYVNSIVVGSGSAWLKTSDDASSTPSGKEALIEFQTGDQGTVTFQDGSKFSLDLRGGLLDELLENPGEVSFQVYFTNGEITFNGDIKDVFELGAGWGLQVEGYELTESGGVLTITGNMNVGELNGDKGDTSLKDLEDKEAVIVTGDTTLESTEGGTLNHLTGESDLTITGNGDVNLNNSKDVFQNGASKFAGKLTTDPGINLHKTGSENLTLSGGLEAEGDLAVDEGGLVLAGQENTVGGALTVGDAETGTKGTLDVQGNLDAKDVDVQNGTLTFGENSDSSIGGNLTLGEDGALQVDGQLTLSGSGDLSKNQGALSGDGTIEVSGEDASLTFGDETTAEGSNLTFRADNGGTLEYTGAGELALPDLTGNGHYKGSSFRVNGDGSGEEQVFGGTVDGKLSLGEGNYNLTNPNNGRCDLVVESGSNATLAAGSTYHSIDNNGRLSTSTSEETGDVCITAEGNIIFRNGAHSPVRIDLSDPELSQSGEEINYKSTAGKIIIEHETELDVTLTGNILDAKGDLNVVIMEAAGGIENHEEYNEQTANYKMKTVRFMAEPQVEEGWTKVEAAAVVKPGEGVNEAVMNQLYDVGKTTFWTKDGQLLTYIPQRTESPWEQYVTTSNSRAGLGLLYRDLHQNGVMEADQDVVALIDGIDRLVQSNPAEARRALAAVAGSTLTSVSAAQSAALRNQMGRVRDHALQVARLRCAGNDEATATQRPCKNSHVWVEGTSFFSEQHSVGDESGYRLNSWGGAVGIDAQVDAHWSVGVSLSASYGDLEARAADYAKGDLDTYTVSFWSQAKNGRWGNTLLFTLGTNEADLKRTVNYGTGSYTATSNTSGSSLGAMWEVTYDLHPVKDNKSNILQPLFNVAVMHTSMDGFSEKNAGSVGLTTEKQTRDTVTLGLGLRWLAAINSAKAVNRTVSTEVHANVAQDMGDRRSVTNVALLADPSYTQNVYGSKAGSTAFQFGAGVNVPMTPNSQIYVNAGGELREHANAWNAALGVRMGF